MFVRGRRSSGKSIVRGDLRGAEKKGDGRLMATGKRVIFSDESKIMIGHDQRVYVWRERDEGRRQDLVQPRTSQPKYEVMIWGCICWNGVGTLPAVEVTINGTNKKKY